MKQEVALKSIWDDHAESPLGVRHVQSPPPLPAECNLPTDQISYSCAPPISQPASADPTAHDLLPADVVSLSLLHSRPRRSRKHLRSTSWLSSITLHIGVILLLALVLVPADYCGFNALSFLVAVDQQSPHDQLVVFEPGVSEDRQTPEEQPTTLASLSTGPLSPSELKAMATARNHSAGPRGSFFGLNAYGHEFVYVLDMSGSMQGQRFDRARAELMRSVEQLGPNQRFYVLLFCSETRQMFDQSEFLPQSVHATPENKERLANWLRSTTLGGGTDPREALEVALRMNPAAIFMLSDGEFNGHKQQKQVKLLGGNTDVFSIVAAAPTKPPIHSIAFEDKKSQENMRRLAEMTAGQFRFVSQGDGAAPEESIQYLRSALQQGDLATAELFISEAAANLAQAVGESTMQSKAELARILFELAENGLNKGEYDAARRALVEYAYIYPETEMIEEFQVSLVGNLLNRANSDPDCAAAVVSLLSEFVKKSPKSTAAKRVCGSLGMAQLDEARQLYAKGEYLESIRKLETMIATFPESTTVSQLQDERDRIAKELLDRAEKLRQQRGNAALINHLRDLAALSEGTPFHAEIILALETQAKEMLVAIRDANYSKDRTTRDRVQQELDAGFGDDPLLVRVRQEFDKNERMAQEIFRRAFKLENPSQVRAALGLYRSIVKDFSGTLVAPMAEERIRILGHILQN